MVKIFTGFKKYINCIQKELNSMALIANEAFSRNIPIN